MNNVKKITLWDTYGDVTNLLTACPNLQHFVVEGGKVFGVDEGLIMKEIKIIELEGFDSDDGTVITFLKMCPKLQDIKIIDAYMNDITSEDFSLCCVTSLC